MLKICKLLICRNCPVPLDSWLRDDFLRIGDGTGLRVGKLRKGRKGRIENSLVDHDYSLVPLRETWLPASASRWNFKARSEFSSLRFDLCTSCSPRSWLRTFTMPWPFVLHVSSIANPRENRSISNEDFRIFENHGSNWIEFSSWLNATTSDRVYNSTNLRFQEYYRASIIFFKCISVALIFIIFKLICFLITANEHIREIYIFALLQKISKLFLLGKCIIFFLN